MEIKLRIRDSRIAEIIVESGNTKIEEDISNYKKEGCFVDDSHIDNFIEIAIRLNRFNGLSDVDLIKKVVVDYFSEAEKEELLEKLQTPTK